jgi:hypothetical protein
VAPLILKRGKDMNIGDVVYIYLFDLEKSLINMKQLREDRFGKIIKVSELFDQSRNEIIKVYEIQSVNKKIITYRTDNLTTSMVSLPELIEIIGRANISSDKRNALIEQINGFVI